MKVLDSLLPPSTPERPDLGWIDLKCAAPQSGAGAVEAKLDPAGEGNGGQQPPALVADRPGDLAPSA